MSENDQILIEQILEKIETINRKINHNPSTPDIQTSDQLEGKLQELHRTSQALNESLKMLNDSQKLFTNKLQNFDPKKEYHIETNHVFFPGILAWFQSMYRGRTILFFALIASLSIMLNSHLFVKIRKYKDAYYKYYGIQIFNENPKNIEATYYAHKDIVIYKVDSAIKYQSEVKNLNKELKENKSRNQQIEKLLKGSK
ncbi:MAG: hypothetical protein KDC79_13960 [Cyclobacteriaceae bacterium]|nr:hypothetical protein [Cyclobacteriaceae bacterium]